MKSFTERNPMAVGVAGLGLSAALAIAALNYQSLPVLNETNNYSAYFANASGLVNGAAVEVSGVQVGRVKSMRLDGPRVLITFDVQSGIRLGDRSEAAIKTKSLLGAKYLEVIPRGEGVQGETIPLDRTTSAYQLPDALGDVASAVSGLDTQQLSASLAVLSETFKDTPPALKSALTNVARFADALDRRDSELRGLLANARKATGVLAEHSDQIVRLVDDTNALLAQLITEANALDHISVDIAELTQQIKGFIGDNRQTLRPALEKLNGVLTIVDNRKVEVQQSIKKLNAYAMSLGESVSSGPFFKAYLVNLLPGQFIQPFVDAAFSDLGLDPATRLPSELVDPQIGQPATPALPVPFPRTGQGGPPRLNLPDAITGNPDDPRYPYRELLPAPESGGPPPGPPAADVGDSSQSPASDSTDAGGGVTLRTEPTTPGSGQ
ncbi:MCE family protein [[Mycobacterium] wendilense]|uniref:MCE family protein n=1 Tax=[Mycobacterium] wendilense TaxID=3064284 RepID=A0ABM9MIK5_9MYCO|nr:MCE family protein [Mycolicibacterium sp. MU0050]CAJ1586083.1 MCE family protein [Mycolicibacterium sp. MU0050]